MVVRELHDQRAQVLGQRGGNLLHELLLALDVDGSEELVLVYGLQQRLVFVLALLLRVGERRHVTQLAIELELRGAAVGEVEEFLRGGHGVILPCVMRGMYYERFPASRAAARSAASRARNPIFGWLASRSTCMPCCRNSSEVVGPIDAMTMRPRPARTRSASCSSSAIFIR